MEKTNFEKLRVYQLAETLADIIWEIVLGWNQFARNTLGIQMVDAADSVGANIAEGTGRGTPPDNRRFVRIARGSLWETKHWLRRAYKRSLLSEKQINMLKPIIGELSPKLNSYLRSINSAAIEHRNKVQSTKYKAQKRTRTSKT